MKHDKKSKVCANVSTSRNPFRFSDLEKIRIESPSAKVLRSKVRQQPGANPTTVSYNATSSLVRFNNNKIFYYEKRSTAYYNAGVVVVCKIRSCRIGSSFAPV
jgi:hypothetical protein